jgi:hypothetical protein
LLTVSATVWSVSVLSDEHGRRFEPQPIRAAAANVAQISWIPRARRWERLLARLTPEDAMTKLHKVVSATTEVELSQTAGEGVHHDGCRTFGRTFGAGKPEIGSSLVNELDQRVLRVACHGAADDVRASLRIVDTW